MVGMCGVCNDFFHLLQVAVLANGFDGSEGGANNLLSSSHHSLECLEVHDSAALMPNGDAVCEDALDCAPIESGKNVWRKVGSP